MLRLLLLLLVLPAAAQARRTVTVAADGSAEYRDVQAAVDSAPDGNLTIRIKPGIYHQVLTIRANGVELRGLGRTPQDVVLTFGNSHAMAGGTAKSASTTIAGNDFYAENLTFENSFARDHPEVDTDAQAVALLTLGDRQVYRRVRLLGAQDTLYANSKTCHEPAQTPCRAARQYFADCYIEGHVDFIFGDARAVFDHCELHARAHPMVMLTAQSRLYPEEVSGYLFLDCSVTADPGAKDIYLGRPWRAYSTVAFLHTHFIAAINPAGWAEWDGRLATSDYSEFASRGRAGDASRRVAPARLLNATEAASLTVRQWLSGPDRWNPALTR